MAEFLTIGEPMVLFAANEADVSLDQVNQFTKYSAGAELNVAIGVARMGHRAEYVSAVGIDPFGSFLKNEINRNHIQTSYLNTDPNHWTGFYLKQLVSKGDPEIFYFRRDSAAAHFDKSTIARINTRNLKLVHLSGIFAALSANNLAVVELLNQQMLDQGVLVTFDPNLRPALWDSEQRMIQVTNDLARGAHVVVPGINEGRTLTGRKTPVEIADFYLNQSSITQTVIVKAGTAGAFVKQRGGRQFKVTGYKVERVIDTVGAGDGFVAGILTALLEDLPIETAVQRGCAIGAMAVMTRGDNDGYPTAEQLTSFYQHHLGGRITQL